MHYLLAMTMLAASATAQVRLPAVPLPAVPLPALPLQTLPQTLGQVPQSLDRLSDLRHLEINRLIRVNRRVIDTDSNGEPVIRGEVLALSPSEAAMNGARSHGFVVGAVLRRRGDRPQAACGVECLPRSDLRRAP